MTLAVSPSSKMSSITKGAEVSFTLNLTDELDGNVVDTYTFKIFDSAGDEATSNFGGGDAIADGIITFTDAGFSYSGDGLVCTALRR